MILRLFMIAIPAILSLAQGDVFYRSPALYDVRLTPMPGSFFIADDNGDRAEIVMMVGEDGAWYWYRRIKTPVCQTGECKLVDVGLYWDLTGDFFGIDVYGEHLTKTDHSMFSDADYRKLNDILDNDWSPLREYDFKELTNETDNDPSGNSPLPDATSGATRKEIASQAVQHAVYTTYTLWHLVHNGEKEQLIDLTIKQLNEPSRINFILTKGSQKHKLFLIGLFSQSRVHAADRLAPLVMAGLQPNADPHLQNLALKSLGRLRINDPNSQHLIANAYKRASPTLRLRMLTSLKDIRYISDILYNALEEDVDDDNEWFSVKVLELLKYAPSQSQAVMDAVNKRLQSDNSYIRSSAEAFVKHVNSSGQRRD